MMNRMMLQRVGIQNLFQNAIIGLSLRSVGFNPTMNKIRVKRVANNDFDEFTAYQIQNTNDIQSFCGASNGVVPLLYNELGAENAYQNDPNKQPLIYQNGNIITYQGKPAIQFDGSNDNLEIDIAINSDVTFFMRFLHQIQNQNFKYIIEVDSSFSDFQFGTGDSFSGSNLRFGIDFGQNWVDLAGTYTPEILLSVFGYRGLNSEIWIDNDSKATGSGFNEPNFIKLFLGGEFRSNKMLFQDFFLWEGDFKSLRNQVYQNETNFYAPTT